MIDYAAILKANPNGVLATQDGQGTRTRVFQYLFSEGSQVYFCTNSQKPVYAQLKANPGVSFCTYPADFNPVLSINGQAVFVDDLALKTRALDENPSIKGIYNTPTILFSKSSISKCPKWKPSALLKAPKTTHFKNKPRVSNCGGLWRF